MRELVQGLCILAVSAVAGHCQGFEVATIKAVDPSGPEKRGASKVESRPGNVIIRNASMGTIMMWAYKISPYQVANGQAISSGDSYDIVAKASGPATTDEMRLMMQVLLADRFQMKTHRETKEQPAYALVEAKGGHKLKESTAADGLGVLPVPGGKMALSGQSATLDQLAMFLSGPLRTPVVDLTGLKGRYDFDFDITNFVRTEPAPGESQGPPDPVAILQMALPKQLGLKLEARKLPIDMLVIDHIEKAPVDN